MRKTDSLVVVLLVLSSGSAGWAQAKPEITNSNAVTGAAVDKRAKLNASYETLRLIWDDCYQIRNLGQDLLNEGKNAPPRNSWLGYFVDSVGRILPKLETEANNLTFPSDLEPALSQKESDIRSLVAQMKSGYVELRATADQVTNGGNDKFPPIYWKPAGTLGNCADKLDALLVSTYSLLDANADNEASPSPAPSAPVSTNVEPQKPAESAPLLTGGATAVQTELSIKSISDAGVRVSKAAFGLIGELERWNLLYGKPPKGGPTDMFYGGGLTEKEVLTQYRYLPTTVFTMPAYVKLYSYRLPPRQNMLAYYTAQIGSGLNLMESELNEVALPQAEEKSLGGPWEELKQTFMDSRSQYLSLLQLVNTSNDERLQKSIREDELTFGAPVSAIYSNMDKLQSLLKDMKAILK